MANEISDLADIGTIEFDFEAEGQRESTQLIPEKHLDSPIIVSLLHRLQNVMANVFNANPDLKETQYDPRRYNCVHKYIKSNPDEMYSSLRMPLMQYCNALDFCKVTPQVLTAHDYPFLYSLTAEPMYRLRSDMKLAKTIYENEIADYLTTMENVLKPEEFDRIRSHYTVDAIPDDEVILSSQRVSLWSQIVDRYRRIYKKNRPLKKWAIGSVRVVICDGFVLLKHDNFLHWKLATYEQIQMIQDCCLARHNVQIALQFGFHNGTERLKHHVSRVLRWQERVLRAIGNDGYELVKAPEAIFKARLNTLTGGDLLRYSSYDRTLDKMREKEKKVHGSTYLVNEFALITESVTDIHDAAELFGLTKLSGHPSVYVGPSADSLRKEAEPEGTIQPWAVRHMTRMFKHLTISGYIAHHSSWPRFVCEPARGTVLRRHYLNQVTELPIGSYPLSDLDAIQFGKFVEYDYSEDYLKFLDDKAICPGAREMSLFWFKGERNESRRLLQKILELEHFDTVELVERLRRGHFHADEYVVELTQKERELKTCARCFCKLPFSVRTFFTSTEYNLKEQFMSKYMPQQTMTMSNTETKQRMYNLVRDAKSKLRTLLEVDFSRWNLRWREATVHPISGQLEDIFGLPGVFSQAHPFFTKATIVMTDKNTLPFGADPTIPVTHWPVSQLVWRGTHLGGFEGIQQALWTVCTIAMMYWVMHDQNLSFNMAGQGDNQIFAITFDDHAGPMDEQLRKLLAVMEIRCALLNHEVKPDECIDSQTVLTYSKDIYVEGNHILYNLKFASRSFRRDEIDVPSLSTEVAGISAVALACADSVYDTPKAIYWKTLLSLRFMSHRYSCGLHTIEKPQLAQILSEPALAEFALRMPGSLGGLPVMQWSRFFLKGEVDDVSWDVPSIMRSSNRLLRWDLRLLLNGAYTPTRPNLQQLILDPHSLPISRPKDLKRLVKDAVAKNILSYTKNKWLRQIFSESEDTQSTQLMDELIKTEPFYPQIMADVYKLSPSGVKDAMLSRFTMTRTIVSIANPHSFATDIEMANASLLRSIIQRYRAARNCKGLPSLPTSSYAACVSLRQLWGPKVHHKNIGVYNPLDFRLVTSFNTGPTISAASRCGEFEQLHTSLGPYPPNFGTKTKQKVSDHGFKIVTSSSTVQDLKRLVLTFSELGAESRLANLLSCITRSRSPWTIEQLMTVLPTSYGGTAAHRHAAINSSAFSILGSRTVPTHLNFCSDASGRLAGGEFDYPIAFQEFYLLLTNVFQVLSFNCAISNNSAMGFLLSDEYEALPTDNVVYSGSPTIRWPIHPTNALCYVSKFQVREVPIIPQTSQIPHTDGSHLPPSVLIYSRLLDKYITKRRLLSSTSSVTLPIEILDMKEFNHCPLSELMRGVAYFITTLAIHAAVREYRQQAHIFLIQCIRRLAAGCAGLLTRMMLHPDFQTTTYAIHNGILSEPGQSGSRAAADRMLGELIETVIMSIKAKELLHQEVPLVLFADYTSRGAAIVEAHVYTLVSLQHRDTSKILLTSRQINLLNSARLGFLTQSSALMTILSIASAGNTCFKPIVKPDGTTVEHSPVKIKFLNKTSDEAIRLIRQLPRDVRLNPSIPINHVPCSFGLNDVRCDIVHSGADGSLLPGHECVDTGPDERRIDNVLSLLLRPNYIFSSTLCIWTPLINRFRRIIQGSACTSIGVGHGAVAACLLNAAADRVYGIDLRNSFPIVTAREGTYKPPEVIRSGRASNYEWSSFVAETGGDAVKNAYSLRRIEGTGCIVIDIEQSIQSVLSILEHLPPCVLLIVRIICCKEWAEYTADAIGADEIYCTSILPTHKRSYILIKHKFSLFNPSANAHRVHIEHERRWRRKATKNIEYARDYFNFIMKPTGKSLKVLSPQAVLHIASECKTESLNINNDETLRLRLNEIAVGLEQAVLAYRAIPCIDVTSIADLSTRMRRFVLIWLANAAYDWDDWIDNYLKGE